MKRLFDRFLITFVLVLVVILVITSLPSFAGDHLDGRPLLAHMMASGALVVALPVLAISMLMRHLSSNASDGIQRLGFWLLVAAGTVTIAAVFLCMLPIPATEQMHQLMQIHIYAGFAMVPAGLLLVLGGSRRRRNRATRSATPG